MKQYKFNKLNGDKLLSTFFHLISIGLNIFAFFNIMNMNSLLPKIVIASFGASLVFLQIDSLRKWKSSKKRSEFLTYLLCTIFSLFSTGYVVTSFSTTQATTRDYKLVNTTSTISRDNKSIDRLDNSNSNLEATISDLKISKEGLIADKEFYGDRFFTLKAELADKVAEIDLKIIDIQSTISSNNSKIEDKALLITSATNTQATLAAEKQSDIFTTLSEELDISLILLTGLVFFLLAAVLELGIFTLTPALHEDKNQDSLIEELLGTITSLELRLKATGKTRITSKKVSIDTYLDAMFSSNGKKLCSKDTVARLTGYPQTKCDDFYHKLTTKYGKQGVPFIQTARGRGTYSDYTKDDIKMQLKELKGARRYDK